MNCALTLALSRRAGEGTVRCFEHLSFEGRPCGVLFFSLGSRVRGNDGGVRGTDVGVGGNDGGFGGNGVRIARLRN